MKKYNYDLYEKYCRNDSLHQKLIDINENIDYDDMPKEVQIYQKNLKKKHQIKAKY